MGLTVLEIDVGNPAFPNATEPVEFLVDSGAIYSVVPCALLDKLGIVPIALETFRLADGSTIKRGKGSALTLEALGLSLDPLRRELKPLPLIIAGALN